MVRAKMQELKKAHERQAQLLAELAEINKVLLPYAFTDWGWSHCCSSNIALMAFANIASQTTPWLTFSVPLSCADLHKMFLRLESRQNCLVIWLCRRKLQADSASTIWILAEGQYLTCFWAQSRRTLMDTLTTEATVSIVTVTVMLQVISVVISDCQRLWLYCLEGLSDAWDLTATSVAFFHNDRSLYMLYRSNHESSRQDCSKELWGPDSNIALGYN